MEYLVNIRYPLHSIMRSRRRIIIGSRSRLLVRHLYDDFACVCPARCSPQEGNRASLSVTPIAGRGGADEFVPRFGESQGCQFRKFTDRSIGIITTCPLSDRKLHGRYDACSFFSGSSLLILFHQQAQQMMSDVRRKSWPRCALSPQFVSALSHAHHVGIPHSLDARVK